MRTESELQSFAKECMQIEKRGGDVTVIVLIDTDGKGLEKAFGRDPESDGTAWMLIKEKGDEKP